MIKEEYENLKQEIKKVAEKHSLLLALLFGSKAQGKILKDSDTDIAVLGVNPISFKDLISLHNEFAEVFKVKEIDVKSLHNTDPLFRCHVMRNAALLYGKTYDYNTFKAYAFRSYHDSHDLLRLKETLTKKRLHSFNV